jgi:hypothetical protein
MLNLQGLRDRLGPNFIPCTIFPFDGRSFKVPHRDFIALGRGLVSVIDENEIQHAIDPLHIASVDDAVSQFGDNHT